MFETSDALFLDFDGTLAPHRDRAGDVHLSAVQRLLLTDAHAAVGGALCLISGRDVDDLALRAPANIPLVGNHGMARIGIEGGSDQDAPEALRTALENLTGAGVSLERKRAVLALHTRRAPEREPYIRTAMTEIVEGHPDYYFEEGEHIFEAKPLAANKGAALTEIMALPPFHGRRPVMVGDDTTDEAAIEAAQALGGLGIKVGPKPSSAHHRVDGPANVFDMLTELIRKAT